MNELTMQDLKDIMANPFYAINIDESLFPIHKPLISQEEWVKVNLRQITEDDDGNLLPKDMLAESIEEWLYRLLRILETGGVRG